jgi:hypothetical protein
MSQFISTKDLKLPKAEVPKALAKPTSAESLTFPQNLSTEVDHWMVLRIQEHKLMAKDDFSKEKDLVRIFLPVPANLSASYNQDYSGEGIGPVGAKAAELSSGGISALTEKITSMGKGDIQSGIKQFGTYYGVQAAEQGGGALIGSAFGASGAIVGAAAGQAIKGGIAGAGMARNPYMAMLYNQPQFRQFQFDWKLVARNADESNILRDIIYKLKFHSSPDTGGEGALKHFFKYPEQFDIDFHYNKFLFNIGPCVLVSMTVNYHAEGQPLYAMVDGTEKAPISVSISTAFQEVTIVTKKEIEKSNR